MTVVDGPINQLKQARDIAMRLLTTREHARVELQRKLHQRGVTKSIVTATLDTLAAEGLQSDARYAQTYVRLRAARGYGPVAITRDLQQRGITSTLIEEASAAEAIDWYVLASTVRCKKFGTALPDTPIDRAKQQRFLQYRGFSHEHIKFAVSDE